jgi:hypothetical protein
MTPEEEDMNPGIQKLQGGKERAKERRFEWQR